MLLENPKITPHKSRGTDSRLGLLYFRLDNLVRNRELSGNALPSRQRRFNVIGSERNYTKSGKIQVVFTCLGAYCRKLEAVLCLSKRSNVVYISCISLPFERNSVSITSGPTIKLWQFINEFWYSIWISSQHRKDRKEFSWRIFYNANWETDRHVPRSKFA